MIAFLAVAVVVIVVPGPDTALTIRNTLRGGRHEGVLTALGVSTGQLCWTIAASAGVVAVLRASQPAFTALRIAGAAYLVVLGLQSLRSAFRGDGHAAVRSWGGNGYVQGLLSNLGNPKMAIFFSSLLPQFASSFAGLVGLGLVFASLTAVWLSAYAAVLPRITRAVRRPLDALSGIVLVALGLRLARD